MVEMWQEIIFAFWVILPAYTANMFPALANGRIPVDFGKKIRDGNRLLGDGKTWEGFLLGLFIGGLVGATEGYLGPWISTIFEIDLPVMSLTAAILLALGALLGDMGGSFIKRRFGLPRGADAPFLDQLDFLMGAIVLGFWFIDMTASMILIMFIITPILHRFVNIIAHWLKLKREPW